MSIPAYQNLSAQGLQKFLRLRYKQKLWTSDSSISKGDCTDVGNHICMLRKQKIQWSLGLLYQEFIILQGASQVNKMVNILN